MKKINILAFFIVIFYIFVFLSSNVVAKEVQDLPDSDGTDLSYIKYSDYLKAKKENPEINSQIEIVIDSFAEVTGDVKLHTEYQGKNENCIYMGEEASVSWKITIPESGMYYINTDYIPVTGKGSNIERAFYIDNVLPFKEASSISFSRAYMDGEIVKDVGGNDLRPKSSEVFEWSNVYFADSSGYYMEPFKFYFSKGEHSIRLESVKEPFVISNLKLCGLERSKDYEQVKASFSGVPNSDSEKYIQAETIFQKSDLTIYPTSDRSSAAMQPLSDTTIRINKIPAEKFQHPGQWITWKFKAEKSGLYKIVMRFRQNSKDGAYVSRRLLIDGKSVCTQTDSLRFMFSDDWQVKALGEKEDYLFNLEEGEHTITLQVVLGDLSSLVNKAEDSLLVLNECYRQILMITGSEPDLFRDYRFEDLIPEVIDELKNQSRALQEIADEIKSQMGGKSGSFINVFEKIVFDLNAMTSSPKKIASKLSSFKSNIGELGSWVLVTIKQPLDIDWICITAPDKELPAANAGIIKNIIHQSKLFFGSFITDYSVIGKLKETSQSAKSIKVWIGSGQPVGRDQSLIIRQMIDQDFMPNHTISVNLQLVAAGTLLRSILAGSGPDVSLAQTNTEPLNYAIRNAVQELTEFPDFKEITKRFNENSLVPFTFQNKVYALPETYSFPMLFYRKDIFAQLGISVPQTWDEVYDVIVKLNMNNMQFGLPPDIYSFTMFLYQNNAGLYAKDFSQTALNQSKALKVFTDWCEYYVSDGLPVLYDLANRFRTGEMPIAIADFSTVYNQLSVFAPEIKGLWEFVPVPGTLQSDGSINRSVSANGTGAVILKSSKDTKASWEFLKWWTSTDIQVQYAQELESIMGVAARYPSANQEAVEKIAWPLKDYRNLMKQWDSVKAIPECPGSYITQRYIDFAFRSVINKNSDPGQTLLNYSQQIDDELVRKQQEFGLNK